MRRDQTTASKIEAFRNQFIYRPLRAMELAVAFQELLRFPCRNWFYIFWKGLCSWSFSIIQARWTTWHLKHDRCLIEFVTSISIRRELVENIAGAAAAAISWGAGVNSIWMAVEVSSVADGVGKLSLFSFISFETIIRWLLVPLARYFKNWS